MKIRAVQGIAGLYELIDDKDHSVLDVDALKFKLDRGMKRQLKNILILVCQGLAIKGLEALNEFIQDDLLKKIERNVKAQKYDLWEVRHPAHGGRIFFIMDNKNNIIVSAVNKQSTKDNLSQEKAINRGINRWEKFLKN